MRRDPSDDVVLEGGEKTFMGKICINASSQIPPFSFRKCALEKLHGETIKTHCKPLASFFFYQKIPSLFKVNDP